MMNPCHSNSLIKKGKEVHAELEIGWAPDRVFMKGILFSIASWTPDTAEELAVLLLSAARKARGYIA